MLSASGVRRVVLYGRTSLDRADGRSVNDQLAVLRAWADRTGRSVVAELRDDDISASRYAKGRTRPGWQRAMDLVTDRAVDELAVWEISRSTRDRAMWAALIGACTDNRVDLVVDGKVHNPSDADDGFVLDLQAAFAVRESAMISKRTRRAAESRAQAGRPAGTVPFGYVRRVDAAGRTHRELHPEQAPIVREIVDRLLAREPANAIANDLNRRGVPTVTGDRWLGRHLKSVMLRLPEDDVLVREIRSRLASGEQPKKIADDLNERGVPKPIPSKWVGNNLRVLASRASYAGLREHQGRVLSGVETVWPAIITEAEHYQLVAMFTEPDRDKFRNPTTVRHIGTGLFRCGFEGCRGRMRLIHRRRGHPEYTCRDCFRISRRQKPVDDLVETVTARRLARRDVLDLLAQAAGDDADAHAAADEVVRLRARLTAARQAWAEDTLDLAEYKDMRDRIEPLIRAAEQRARPRALPSAVFEVAGADAEKRWPALDVATKRAIIAALVDVTIMPVGRQAHGFDPERVRIEWRSGS